MAMKMPLEAFTKDEKFPFFIQYGFHDEPMYLHEHDDYYELVIVMNGKAVHIVDGERYNINKGDVFVIGPETVHGYDEPSDLRICNIMFRRSFLDMSSMDIAASPGFQALFVLEPAAARNKGFCSNLHLSPDGYAEVKRIIKQLHEEYYSGTVGRKTMIRGDFLRLAVVLSRLYEIDDTSGGEGFIKLAEPLTYIEQNLAGEITVEELASLANYSQRHLIRLFREAFDCVPSVYITRLRMKNARELLADTELMISEVAARCGYTDSNLFSRIFKKYNGVPPSRFRELRKIC
ncbi:MAG: helix-turn-helix domain-containing protein [Ruminococcus sp.]|nr:helix-turn-helix domain-containing protein [Ruminococcus sp.]